MQSHEVGCLRPELTRHARTTHEQSYHKYWTFRSSTAKGSSEPGRDRRLASRDASRSRVIEPSSQQTSAKKPRQPPLPLGPRPSERRPRERLDQRLATSSGPGGSCARIHGARGRAPPARPHRTAASRTLLHLPRRRGTGSELPAALLCPTRPEAEALWAGRSPSPERAPAGSARRGELGAELSTRHRSAEAGQAHVLHPGQRAIAGAEIPGRRRARSGRRRDLRGGGSIE